MMTTRDRSYLAPLVVIRPAREAARLTYGGEAAGGGSAMLNWALAFFVFAILAAVVGFGGIAAGAAGVAKVVFLGFIVLAVVSLIAGLARGRAS